MDTDRLSAVASGAAALLIVLASNKQWWTIAMNGDMVTKRWARRMLIIATGWLVTALVLLLIPFGDAAIWVAIGAGLTSCAIAWPLGTVLHRKAVETFKRAHPGLAGAPLAGGDFE
jgi:hypothetical protein